jgi:hypothetical protein
MEVDFLMGCVLVRPMDTVNNAICSDILRYGKALSFLFFNCV